MLKLNDVEKRAEGSFIVKYFPETCGPIHKEFPWVLLWDNKPIAFFKYEGDAMICRHCMISASICVTDHENYQEGFHS